MQEQANGPIAAYISISMSQIERSILPRTLQRNQPDPLPALLLGQLAVDLGFQGKGYGHSLLRFALATAARASVDVGCFCVVLHPLDDQLRGFYRRFGFMDMEGDPARAMIVRLMDLEPSEL